MLKTRLPVRLTEKDRKRVRKNTDRCRRAIRTHECKIEKLSLELVDLHTQLAREQSHCDHRGDLKVIPFSKSNPHVHISVCTTCGHEFRGNGRH